MQAEKKQDKFIQGDEAIAALRLVENPTEANLLVKQTLEDRRCFIEEKRDAGREKQG